MSIRELTIYYDLSTGTAYLESGAELNSNSAPYLYYSEKVVLNMQYLASSAQTDGAFTDFYTGFDGLSLGSSLAIDNNNVFYRTAALSTPLTAATPVSTIVTSVPDGVPRSVGTLKLTNAGGDVESVNYNGYTAGTSSYTFNTADADFALADYTPTYSFAASDVILVREVPLVKTVTADFTDQATGLFVMELDGWTVSLYEEIEGLASLTASMYLEHKLYNSSGGSVNNPELIVQVPFYFKNLIDYEGPVPPAPSSDYYTIAQLTALLTPFTKTFTSATADAFCSWTDLIATITHSLDTATPTVTLYIDGEQSTAVVVAVSGNNSVTLDFGNLGDGYTFTSATVKISKH